LSQTDRLPTKSAPSGIGSRNTSTMSKATGLAAFTRVPQPSAETAAPEQEASSTAALPQGRVKGRGKFVSLTVRLTRTQWERLHQLAVSEGVSLQQLALRGLSRNFEEKGLVKL
jgi:hypothetical protein